MNCYITDPDQLIERIESECDLPDGWSAFKTTPIGTIEVSGFDGEEQQEAILEVIAGDQVTEIIINHSRMPGRLSANNYEERDEPASDIPDQAGVLQFATRDEALAALDELADPDIIEEVARTRSFVENDDPLDVTEAVREASNVDVSTIKDTSTGI